jgi:putative transposase
MFIQNNCPQDKGSRRGPAPSSLHSPFPVGAGLAPPADFGVPTPRAIHLAQTITSAFSGSFVRTYFHELPSAAPLRIIARAVYPDRQSIRLPDYDYSRPGMYFVTICTHQREPILGVIDAGHVIPTDAGKFVEDTWLALPNRFPNLRTDEFTLMPNHVHAILFIESRQSRPGGASPAPTKRTSLADVVCAFKSISTLGVNKLRITPGQLLWQRNYYEHIIRSSQSLVQLRRYIQENPARWSTDEENPSVSP